MGKINFSKTTFLIIILAVGFFVGVSFTSVYAGVLVDTEDIADNAITSEKIKQREVKSRDIKNNAVKTNKIRDGTITLADLAPGVVDDADSDPTNELQTILQKRVDVQPITVDGFISQSVSCGTGWIATGGGPGGLGVGVSLVASFPSNIESDWIVAFEGSGSI